MKKIAEFKIRAVIKKIDEFEVQLIVGGKVLASKSQTILSANKGTDVYNKLFDYSMKHLKKA